MASSNHFMHTLLLALKKHSSRPLVKVLSSEPGAEIPSWSTVTYSEFTRDMDNVAGHWVKTLGAIGIQQSSVVGLWLTGSSYEDIVNMYAIARAGYIPQLFNITAPFDAIIELLAFTKGKALLYHPSLADRIADFGLPTFPFPGLDSVAGLLSPLPDLPAVEPTDMGIIFHTTGSTSGKPKPIPEPHRWIVRLGHSRKDIWAGGSKPSMLNNIGSFANLGAGIAVYHLAFTGCCLIQSPRPDFDTAQLIVMTKEGMNFLQLYGPWLSKLLDISRNDPHVLEILQNLVQIAYTGAALNPDDERWALEQKIPVTVFYATTETSICLVSDFGAKSDFPLMRLAAPEAKMIPAGTTEQQDLDGDNSGRFQGGTLYDLFIPDTSDHCPHPWVRNRSDGHVTGDLFEEVKPGLYAFRGRSDDWIKTGANGFFCDTKSVEDNVLRICPDLVQGCVVVGHNKPRVVLLLEPFDVSFDYETGTEALKREILERTASFNERLFPHERITDPSCIVVLKPGSLPRTIEKGNVRRKATEERYADILNNIYSKVVAV